MKRDEFYGMQQLDQHETATLKHRTRQWTKEHHTMTDPATTDLAEAPFTWRTLTAIADTEFVPKAYRGNPDKMLGAILYGRESGLGPMTALQMVDMVDGKPSMSTELMVSLVRQHGHSLVAADWTPTSCTAVGKRHDSGDEMQFTFNLEDAERAGLAGRGAWKQYPAAMLWNRAASQLIRVLFPDCLISMHSYDPEELGSEYSAAGPSEPPPSGAPIAGPVAEPPTDLEAEVIE